MRIYIYHNKAFSLLPTSCFQRLKIWLSVRLGKCRAISPQEPESMSDVAPTTESILWSSSSVNSRLFNVGSRTFIHFSLHWISFLLNFSHWRLDIQLSEINSSRRPGLDALLNRSPSRKFTCACWPFRRSRQTRGSRGATCDSSEYKATFFVLRPATCRYISVL